MKQPSEDNKQKKRIKTLHSLCSVSALLLSVVCCMALIHVELRIQEHHRLISHSVTVCDQMETQILRKVEQNYERWQVRKVDNFKDQRQETNGEDKLENNVRFSLLPIYICPKKVPFSVFRVGVSLVEVYGRVGKSVI